MPTGRVVADSPCGCGGDFGRFRRVLQQYVLPYLFVAARAFPDPETVVLHVRSGDVMRTKKGVKYVDTTFAIKSYHTKPYHCHAISCHTVLYHAMPCHAIPYHTIPWHVHVCQCTLAARTFCRRVFVLPCVHVA